MAGRKPGKCRLLSIYEICRQISLMCMKRNIDKRHFADCFITFCSAYSKIAGCYPNGSRIRTKSKTKDIKWLCKYVWNYLFRQQINQEEFSTIFLAYCQIKEGFDAYKKSLNSFREQYNVSRS